MNCSRCDKTDELVYTSVPPKLRCTITGKFHFGTDDCDVEFVPVVHGRWMQRANGEVYCSHCNCNVGVGNLSDVTEEENYCYNCGARMDG